MDKDEEEGGLPELGSGEPPGQAAPRAGVLGLWDQADL